MSPDMNRNDDTLIGHRFLDMYFMQLFFKVSIFFKAQIVDKVTVNLSHYKQGE